MSSIPGNSRIFAFHNTWATISIAFCVALIAPDLDLLPSERTGGGGGMARLILVVGLAWLVLADGASAADPGVSSDRIVMGQSAPLEGPASALGTGMRDGLLAAFAEANAVGSVKGRKLDSASSYGAAIQVLWVARDLGGPAETLRHEVDDFLVTVRAV